MADKRIDQLVAATTVGDDDLLVLQQNNQAKKLSGKKLGDYVYAAATGKIAEVEQAVADAQAAIDDLESQKDTIAQAVADMADLGTDTTLTTPGMAADAEATGDAIAELEAIVDAIADREDTVIASTNYSSGALVLVGNTLVEVTSPIATGESINPLVNCQTTTIAAQIAYLKSNINTLGNLAYLSYETA